MILLDDIILQLYSLAYSFTFRYYQFVLLGQGVTVSRVSTDVRRLT